MIFIILLCSVYAIEKMKFMNELYYSDIILHESQVKESGNNWITVENVILEYGPSNGRTLFCYNPRNYTKFVEKIDKLHPLSFYSVFSVYPLYFENYFVWPNEEGVWYYSSFCSTLYHRWDTFMLYLIDKDKNYPPIHEVIFDNYCRRCDSNEMQNYYNLILEKKIPNAKFYYKEEMYSIYRKYIHILFKKIHIVFRSGYIGFYFIDRNKAKEFRDYGMSISNIENQNRKEIENYKNIISVCLIQRNNTKISRNIININEIYSLLNDYKKKRKKERIRIDIISFDGINSVEQIKVIMNRDIIISPHGTGLVNMLWILKKKVTVIEGYSIFRADCYLKLSTTFGFHYFPLSSERIYDDMSFYYDFENEKNDTFYYNNYPQVHHNFFSNHPLRLARTSQMKLNLKQILYGVIYSLNYISI